MPPSFTPYPVEIDAPDISRWQASPLGLDFVHERIAADEGPDVLVSALVHGNEYSGAIVVDELLALGFKPRRGRVTFVFANIDGFSRFDKTLPDASRYVEEDFNRVWSAERLAREPATSEVRRARSLAPFVERATHLIDLHSMHEPCEPLLITGHLPRNVEFARSLGGVGQVVIDTGHKDGVRMRDYRGFGSETGSKIALLLEAGQHWQRSSLEAARDVLMRFLWKAGCIERSDIPAGWLQADRTAPAPVQVTHAVVAKSMDFSFTAHYTGNEIIRTQGSVIAHDAGQPVTTPYDNCVLVMPSIRQLRPGVTTVRLGQRIGS